jgi:hypothetical protein
MLTVVVPAMAMLLALAEPPNVAVELGEPDWEVGRERIVVALTGGGIEPVAAGAAGYRLLATVRASCRDDAFAVELRLLDARGEVYEVERVTGVGCTADAGADAGAWVVERVEASCRDRPCTAAPPSPIIVIACGPPSRSPWSFRVGAGVLAAPGRGLGPSGALALGTTWAFSRWLAFDVDAVGSFIPAHDRSGAIEGAIGFGLGRAHMLVGAGRRLRVDAGLGGGALVAWAATPDVRVDGRSSIAATGLLSTVLRVTYHLDRNWALHAGTGLGFGLPAVELRSRGRAPVLVGKPIVDATLGLEWHPGGRR